VLSEVVFLRFLISIHTPAKGATLFSIHFSILNHIFQSTHPRRVRLITTIHFFPFFPISIHTPAKGATAKQTGHLNSFGVISIHTPAKGATIDN